jgi:hypothetical protein
MRSVLILALSLAAAPACAQPTAITSAYTKLDLDACKAVDSGEEAAWMEWECDGYGGLPLFVQSGDDRYDLDAGARDEDEHWAATFDYPGDTVEWRLQGGKPFAIIYRLRNANPDRPASSMLIVESVGDGAKLGCRVAEIDGATTDANVLARQAADTLLADAASCLKGE